MNTTANVSTGLADQAIGAGATGPRTSTFGRSANLTSVMVALSQPPTVVFIHADQLGSTRMLTDGAGVIRGTFSYDPYGNLTASSGFSSVPFGYCGQYRDAESGLIYLRARYYDPSTGQFTSLDSAVAATRQPYAYVANNPLNGTDPTGLWCTGVGYGGSAWVGIGLWGAGAHASVAVTYCSNGQVAILQSTGAGAGAHVAAGAYAGAGPFVFYSDAKSPQQLAGPFNTVEIGGGFIEATVFQLSIGSASVGSWSPPFVPPGAGIGFGSQNITTSTTILGSWDLAHLGPKSATNTTNVRSLDLAHSGPSAGGVLGTC